MQAMVAALRFCLGFAALVVVLRLRNQGRDCMKCPKILAALLGISLYALSFGPAHAAINPMNLGASYDAQQANITFRVYSSSATRVMVYLYVGGYGRQDALRYVLSPVGN